MPKKIIVNKYKYIDYYKKSIIIDNVIRISFSPFLPFNSGYVGYPLVAEVNTGGFF
jgi:hypothetical protein